MFILASIYLISSFVQDSEKAKLYAIIEEFRMCIIEQKSEEDFTNLFLHHNITWSAILEGKTAEHYSKTQPQFRFTTSSPKKFYSKLKQGDEEKFYNIRTDIRGAFATISFDYSFHSEGKIKNWGTEYWSLIKIKEVWKISSVTWTMNFEEHEICPFNPITAFRLSKADN